MRARQKAKELVNKFENLVPCDKIYEEPIFNKQIACALEVVDEILYMMLNTFDWDEKTNGNIHFWQEVRTEIEGF